MTQAENTGRPATRISGYLEGHIAGQHWNCANGLGAAALGSACAAMERASARCIYRCFVVLPHAAWRIIVLDTRKWPRLLAS